MSLPKGTELGTLHMIDVIDSYDGPRLFVAANAVGTYYLALWKDHKEQTDFWLYVPISERRLDELYSGAISIRDAYIQPEEPWVYFVTESLSTSEPFICEAHTPGDLDPEQLPPIGDCIKSPDPFSAAKTIVEREVALSCVHRILIYQQKKRMDFAAVSRVLEAWTSTVRAAIEHPLVPVNAAIGSFGVELGAEEKTAVENFFHSLHRHLMLGNEIGANSEVELRIFRQLCRLLNEIVTTGLTLKASIVLGASDVPDIVLTRENVKGLLVQLNKYLVTRLISIDIPQADNIFRLFRLIEIISLGQDPITKLQITPRQVAYYKHAARALGYLDDYNVVTSQGKHLLILNDVGKLSAAKLAFEGSTVGFAWLQWSSVLSVEDIDPDSACDFLSQVVVNLSEDTTRRRSKTLRSWAKAVI